MFQLTWTFLTVFKEVVNTPAMLLSLLLSNKTVQLFFSPLSKGHSLCPRLADYARSLPLKIVQNSFPSSWKQICWEYSVSCEDWVLSSLDSGCLSLGCVGCVCFGFLSVSIATVCLHIIQYCGLVELRLSNLCNAGNCSSPGKKTILTLWLQESDFLQGREEQ